MTTTAQPHIVLIMADHLRLDSLSCYNPQTQVRTPHLDALADESVVFDHVYCATPLCVPTRCAMYTGKWLHTHGAIVNGWGLKPGGRVTAEHKTVHEILDRAGYGLTQMGVHHLKTDPSVEQRVPRARFLASMGYEQHCEKHGISLGPDVEAMMVPNIDFRDGKPIVVKRPQARKARFDHPAEDYRDVFWSRRMTEQIAELDVTRPQYIEALFWAPHPPLSVPEPYFSMYPEDRIVLPETVGRWCDGQPASLLWQSCGMMGLGLNREEYRQAFSAHFGLTTMVDECIGRVVAALKDKGIWDRAWVIFTQDHGDLLGCHHLTQKHCFYEEAAHIPLMVKPPSEAGISPAPRRQLINATDYCPSICDLAGVAPPDDVQGRSWRPLLDDPAKAWPDATFMEYNGDRGRNTMPMRSIVADVNGSIWKYNWTYGDVDELYDLAADRLETTSLVNNPDRQRLRTELRGRLQQWMRQTSDIIEMS